MTAKKKKFFFKCVTITSIKHLLLKNYAHNILNFYAKKINALL